MEKVGRLENKPGFISLDRIKWKIEGSKCVVHHRKAYAL